jgi:hypothetical protein
VQQQGEDELQPQAGTDHSPVDGFAVFRERHRQGEKDEDSQNTQAAFHNIPSSDKVVAGSC